MTASLTTTVGQLKKKKTVDRPAPASVLKKPDLARRHAFNKRVLTSVNTALDSQPDDAEEVCSLLIQSKSHLDTRQKHLRTADKFDWETVGVYADGPVGDNCEDDRHIPSAASLACRLARGSQDDPPAVSQHRRSFRNFTNPTVHRHTSSAMRLFDPRCYLCGETGHIARRCHLLWSSQQRQRDRLASSASPWPSRNQWRPSTPAPTVSQISHSCQRGQRSAPIWEVAAETKISVECGHDVAGSVCVQLNEPDPIDDNSLSWFDCPYPNCLPKGDSFSDARVLALPFWREIDAKKFVLSVISEGYFLPFDSLFFNNLPSAAQNEAFISQAVHKQFWDGKRRFFHFNVLPFGLSTAPYLFTKMLRPLIQHWQRDGLKIFMYLDDWTGGGHLLEYARARSHRIQLDLFRSGFNVHLAKVTSTPSRR